MGIRCTGSRPSLNCSRRLLFRFLDGREQWHFVDGEPARYSLFDGINQDSPLSKLKGISAEKIEKMIVFFKRVYVPVEGKILKVPEYHQIDTSEGLIDV